MTNQDEGGGEGEGECKGGCEGKGEVKGEAKPNNKAAAWRSKLKLNRKCCSKRRKRGDMSNFTGVNVKHPNRETRVDPQGCPSTVL